MHKCITNWMKYLSKLAEHLSAFSWSLNFSPVCISSIQISHRRKRRRRRIALFKGFMVHALGKSNKRWNYLHCAHVNAHALIKYQVKFIMFFFSDCLHITKVHNLTFNIHPTSYDGDHDATNIMRFFT